MELLEGALFAREINSRMQLVRPVLDALFVELEADEDVAAVLAERRRRKADEKGAQAKVEKIATARRRRKGGSGGEARSSS